RNNKKLDYFIENKLGEGRRITDLAGIWQSSSKHSSKNKQYYIQGGKMMKKSLKMLGIIAFYYITPVVLIILVTTLLRPFAFFQALTKSAGSSYFLITHPIIIGLYVVFFRTLKRQQFKKYCNFSNISPSKLLQAIAFGALLGIFTYSLMNISYIQKVFPSLQNSFKYFIIQGNLFLLLASITMDAFLKEIGFRGLIFNELREQMPPAPGLIIQALLYGVWVFLSTFDPLLAFYGALGAFMLGLAYYLVGSIWASISVGVCNSFAMILIDRTKLVGMFTNGTAIIIIPVTVILVVGLIMLMSDNRQGLGGKESTVGAK
ncbi:MAG TPA: CPBP family intramembrane glutamic endopeptidase, partial [Bacillota bacterium]|nr:CPBP family intramembrane glutamic endopeptidase [Bacillota bacterium]